MMELFIELHNHADIVHGKFQYKFDSQGTLDQLKEIIHSKWNINNEDQQLFFESGKELVGLGEKSIQSFGLKHGGKVIVKHAFLNIWSAYLFFCKSANDMQKAKPEQTQCAYRAIANSKKLEDSGFFEVYVNFVTDWVDTIGQMMRFVDRTQNAFKQSATTFFSKMYPNSKIDFKPKQGGTRAGIVATVTCNGEETNYYMKTYHHAGSSISLQYTSKQHLPDLREMFAYRLLELIGVGPVVFFPFYAGSTYIHYIATKEVSEFKELDKLEDVSVQNKVVVEACLLLLILGIRYLNEGNIGLTKEKTLSIVDFYVPDADNFLRRKILDDFKNKSNFGGVGKANEILTEIGHEERMKIAKDALPHWSRINSMTSNIIGIEKSELREHGIKFGTATDDVDNYLQDIKLNYASICLAFQ